MRATAAALVFLVLLQIYLGALVAGLDAGLTYNTWPLIDGAFVPTAERLWFEAPAWRNLFENPLMVQFNHRIVAYLLWAASLAHVVDVVRTVRGVVEVNTVGGFVREIQIAPDVRRLSALTVTLDDLIAAVEKNNGNVGAG